jgi:hypothetical protein
MTTVLPQASAGASFHPESIKVVRRFPFHGQLESVGGEPRHDRDLLGTGERPEHEPII